MKELDLFNLPLKNLNLFEASAGTGKTWTITGLYLRLILEKGLAVEQILVVTYTKAATAELKERIRNRLAEVLQSLETAIPCDDFCRKMLERIAPDIQPAKKRLKLALCNFDEASIFTIHGFCQRALSDHAFETGMEFDNELAADETAIIREIVDDFWRQETAKNDEAWINYLAEKKQTPDAWLKAIKTHIGKPYMKLAEIKTPSDSETFIQAIKKNRAKAQTLCSKDFKSYMLKLDLNQVSYKRERLALWLEELNDYFKLENLPMPASLAKFTPEALQKGVKKNGAMPEHPIFAHCQDLLKAQQKLEENFEARLIQTKINLLKKCDEELPERKSAKNLISYNDLLNHLADSLETQDSLAEVLRKRYPAALIDEFQDTDPVQYSIFKKLYQDKPNAVFFVGDPKQAIYGFRGADIFSYLQARDKTPEIHTLATNQRSESKLVHAINALFSLSSNPFLFEKIAYIQVKAADKIRPTLQCEKPEPLRFLLLPEKQDEKGNAAAYSKAEADWLSSESAATEIAHLLKSKPQIGLEGQERALNGGDIAILVPSHRQALSVQKSLNQRNIPSVRQGQDNVFSTPEAVELSLILSAVAEPSNDAKLLSALATEIMGYEGAELFALKNEESLWDEKIESFSHYSRLWHEKGFTPMFRRLFEENAIAKRLLSFNDGERRLTNLLHLAECLQVAHKEQPSLDGLLSWFCQTLADPDEDEQNLLRLESDAERVKIVTIHTSKGLEYPIVFCPFLWDGKLWHKNETEACYHDENLSPMLDLGGPDMAEHKALAEREKFAEKLRLLYVALTRAKYRCYLTWGHVKDMQNSALAWILHGPEQADEKPLNAMAKIFETMDHAKIAGQLIDFQKRLPENIGIQAAERDASRFQPSKALHQTLEALSWKRKSLRSSWRMTSFSALSQNRHSETPDYDAPVLPTPSTLEDDSIFSFPRGKTAGRCLHSILEVWDFKSNDSNALNKLIERKLKAHAIPTSWTPCVAQMIQNTLNTPLNGLKLTEIGQSLPEMEFTFPLQSFNVRQLQTILADPRLGLAKEFAQACQKLSFDAVQGYMKGFIDLCFEANGQYYLIDYKSNWLGDSLADYAEEKLIQAMAHEHYYLQYLIYTLALHRYLKLRVPDYDYQAHFGGVFYLFLRGMDPAGDTGLFKDKPCFELIEKLDKAAS